MGVNPRSEIKYSDELSDNTNISKIPPTIIVNPNISRTQLILFLLVSLTFSIEMNINPKDAKMSINTNMAIKKNVTLSKSLMNFIVPKQIHNKPLRRSRSFP